MVMKTSLLIISFFTLLCFSSNAQEVCVVKVKEITGEYSGACAGGKANGKGKAAGIDVYEGEFVNGYPEGKGMYTWKDGHYFIGFYKKGNKEGKGDMYYEGAGGGDSVITGYWKKDKYIGEYEKQFVVVSSTSGIMKVDCSLTDNTGADINITLHQLKNSSNSIMSTSTIPFINDIANLSGTFYSKNSQVLSNSSVTRIRQATFPFEAILYVNNGEYTQILFNVKGNYDVTIDMR
jgi:hypothetical protein